MSSIERLRRRMNGARDLHSVVKSMKAMSAARIWQFEEAVAALTDYRRTVELGLQIVLREQEANLLLDRQPQGERLAAIVLGSDQGLVGHFNNEIVDFALEEMNALQAVHAERQMVAVGQRVEAQLTAADQPVVAALAMPGSLAGVTAVMQDLVPFLESWWSDEQFDRIMLFYNRPAGGASYDPQRVQLMPIDLNWLRALQLQRWESPRLPTFDMAHNDLFAALVQEYFYVATHRAFAESLAAENASRLASMQAAERNIEERLQTLEHAYHQQRQQMITSELLDIVSGAEATKQAEGEQL